MTNTIRRYKNTIFIEFSEHGKPYSLDVPHYKYWCNIIELLSRRGFVFKVIEKYLKEYKCLSKYHKNGKKKDLHVSMEIGCNRIEVEFGNVKNVWDDEDNFWSDKKDSRYTKLSYLEERAIELEIKKVVDFFTKINFTYVKDSGEMSSTEKIIYDNNVNRHIHGHISTLEDIGKAIEKDSYIGNVNSFDKNKKIITCGEVKYFYDYRTKRLSRGVVYHNINDTWYVFVNESRLENVRSSELFDYSHLLPKRKQCDDRKILQLLQEFSKTMDYERCISIRNYAKKNGLLK